MSFLCIVFFLQKKTANKMRISDWSSDVCFSDQPVPAAPMPSTPAAASPWRAQLGAFAVDGNARKLWKSLEKKYPKLAARQPYLVKSAKLTRLQAGGFASKAEAQSFCATMKQGGQSCLVIDRSEKRRVWKKGVNTC